MNIFEKVPDIEEMFEVFKYMTPMMKEKLVDYFSYAWVALAQDSLEQTNRDVERWGFAILCSLKNKFGSLKLSMQKQEIVKQ